MLGLKDHALDPSGKCVQQLDLHLGIGPTASHRHMKGMICARKFFQDCPRAESLAERLELLQVCERIPRPLQKQHGDVNLEKMLAAVLGGAPGGMQRKAEKRQSTNARKRRDGLSLRTSSCCRKTSLPRRAGHRAKGAALRSRQRERWHE